MPHTCTLQDHVGNQLDARVESARWVAGIIGENPSRYAKSPAIWNPVLQALGMDAVYLPFDIAANGLGRFVEAVRYDERIRGFSVTMPYKACIIPLLDELDPKARAIGAVNVVVRKDGGRLIGANTDGSGGLASLTTPLAGEREPFMDGLAGRNVLLMGSGGAAKALAWYLAEAIGAGRLYLATRDRKSGGKLCAALGSVNSRTSWIEESVLHAIAPSVDLIVNATTKGQSGLRTLPDGHVTCLEPYSSLAPARPAVYPAARAAEPDFHGAWYRESLPDLVVNLERSVRLMAAIPPSVRVLDIVYSPFETTLLRHARWSGHRSMNGKGMNICQAADAMFHWVLRDHFETAGQYEPAMYRTIVEKMTAVW
jgi:shikimate dehydrogenase